MTCADRPGRYGPGRLAVEYSQGGRRRRRFDLSVDEQVKPIEQHGFTIADFTPDTIVLRFFKWDVKTQAAEALDTLEPFHTAELKRPV